MMREEYPRPQLKRKDWMNLNGEWKFEFDDRNIGTKEKWYQNPGEFTKTIIVPFAYQTELSGIYETSFHDIIWYSRKINVPIEWKEKNVLLHFGAVDYRAWVYVNGDLVGTHEGGGTPFSFDIKNHLNWEEDIVSLKVEDPSTDETITRGKQYWKEKSEAIWYTRTSGIWQTVWLESVNPTFLKKVKFTPFFDEGEIQVELEVEGDFREKEVDIEITFKGEVVIHDSIFLLEKNLKRSFDLFSQQIFRTNSHNDGWSWTPENPNLFDCKIKMKNNSIILDEVESYFGMRKVHVESGMVYLNNRPYYQKLVLDQGYWSEGLLTAPTDTAFKQDILLSKEMGFNGCRKHQKTEDPRFLYWADKLGFLVWGECASPITFSNQSVERLLNEWMEIVERDYNHPSIVVWVPLNESWGVSQIKNNFQQQNHSLTLYHMLKSLDPTRLIISNDGWEMTKTDITAIHNYAHGSDDETKKQEVFKETLLSKEEILTSVSAKRSIYADGFSYQEEPILLTEFGGIAYKLGKEVGWGYTSVANQEEFLKVYRRILSTIYESTILYGYCYTQLTDVEQEINGLLTYDRKPKVPLNEIRKINELWHKETI